MKGLEIAEVLASKVLKQTETRRIDPEYFQRQHLKDEALISSRPDEFTSFKQIGIAVDASAFYPSIESYYGEGDLPFLRVADVDSVIDFEGCTRIPEKLCDMYPTLSRVKPGDILFTKGGSVARVGLVTESAAASRDLIFLNSSKLPPEDQAFLYLYFQTAFFNRKLLRSSSQTAQPHLTITLVRELKILKVGQRLKDLALEFVTKAFEARELSTGSQKEAEAILLNAIDLKNWHAPEPLSYVRSSSSVFAAGRLDAEHFQEKYYALHKRLVRQPLGFSTIGQLASGLTNGAEIRQYQTDGTPYLRVGDIKNLTVDGDSVVKVDSSLAKKELTKVGLIEGDVLVSRSGSLAVTAVVEPEWSHSLISSHLIRVRIEDHDYDPYYVALFLSATPGRMQIFQWSNGGVQPEINQPSLSRVVVPLIPKEIQIQLRESVLQSRRERQRATEFLEAAKRAVEIAIEQDEQAALQYLEAYS